MVAYAPKDSAQRMVNPTWSQRTPRERKVGPLVDGHIVSEE